MICAPPAPPTPSLINNVISEFSQSWGYCRSKHANSLSQQLIFIDRKQNAPLFSVFLIVLPAVNLCLSVPQTFGCWLKFQTLLLRVVPWTSWQHSCYHHVLIVLCDGNDCASLELCRFSHSLWACLFPQSNLQVGGKKETKRGLLGAHNRSIIAALIDRLISKETKIKRNNRGRRLWRYFFLTLNIIIICPNLLRIW